MKELRPRYALSDVLLYFDAIAPWDPVLRGGDLLDCGDGSWLVPDGAVFRVVGSGVDSRLIASSDEDDRGRTCSQALVELYFEDDGVAAAEALHALARGEGPLRGVLPEDVAVALRDRINTGRTISIPGSEARPAATPPLVTVPAATPVQAVSLDTGFRASGCPPLDAVRDFIARFLVLPTSSDYDVMALWVAHTYVIDAFDVTPRLAFMSPQKASGKTRAMDLLDLLVHNPLPTVNTSTAALFRSIHQADGRMTLLLDEADTVFQPANGSSEDIRGILNASYKRGADVLRSGPKNKDFMVERYKVFAPVAMAGLGRLPDTLTSRSIVMAMRRRTDDEHIDRFRRRDVQADVQALSAGLARWSDQTRGKIHIPALPPELTDRAAEIWEPLLAVADIAGPEWATAVRVAAVAAVAGSSGVDDQDTRLLAAIRDVFQQSGDSKMHTEKLLKKLEKQDLVSVSGLTGLKLADILAPYDIKPKMFRNAGDNRRGYKRSDFTDAWSRYLPPP